MDDEADNLFFFCRSDCNKEAYHIVNALAMTLHNEVIVFRKVIILYCIKIEKTYIVLIQRK